jgi:hypothetical protein
VFELRQSQRTFALVTFFVVLSVPSPFPSFSGAAVVVPDLASSEVPLEKTASPSSSVVVFPAETPVTSIFAVTSSVSVAPTLF